MSKQIELPNVEVLQKMLIELAQIESGELPGRKWTLDDLAAQIASLDRRVMQVQVTLDTVLQLVRLLQR